MTLRSTKCWPCKEARSYFSQSEIPGGDKGNGEPVTEGLTDLLAAVESLTFLPSKDAKCCSRASRRLLGACCDRKHAVSQDLRGGQWSWSPHGDHRGQWWAAKIQMRK